MKAFLSRHFALPIWALLLGGLLLGAGAATQPKEEPAESKTGTVTSVVTKEVPKTPRACVEAIGFAREGFDIASSFARVVSDIFTAASTLDVEEMERQSTRLAPLNTKISDLAPRFNGASAECEASE